MEGEGKEGDWQCRSCRNRNYAFRTFCNRCKQPRLLVDTKPTADSKWIPRIGDWICTGCTNNNYASREKCKKCGKPKELAAMPAITMHGVSLRTHPHHFSMTQGVQESIMNSALFGNGVLQLSLPLSSNWSLEEAHKYGNQKTSTWPFSGNASSGLPLANQANQLPMGPTGWRSGDWICNCGFHNYSSREQCKRCNASMPPVLGTKRLASEELVYDWGNKRMNVAQTVGMQCVYPSFDQAAVSGGNQTTGGAKQWRDGDWMCTNCNNHNYACRSQCNRCKTQKDASAQSVSVV